MCTNNGYSRINNDAETIDLFIYNLYLFADYPET